MPWDSLQCVIVVFPDHTHLIFVSIHLLAILYESIYSKQKYNMKRISFLYMDDFNVLVFYVTAWIFSVTRLI